MGPFSNYSFKETVLHTTAPAIGNEVFLSIPSSLPERRLYAYLETIAAGNTTTSGVIEFRRNRSLIGSIPIEVGAGLIASDITTASLLNYGGTPVGDCLVLTLGDPFTVGTSTATVQPLRLNVVADELRFRIVNVTGTVTGWRLYLGCLSVQPLQ